MRRIEKLRINIVVKVRGWHQLLPGGMCSSRSTCTSAASSSGRSLGDTRTCLLLGLPPGLLGHYTKVRFEFQVDSERKEMG